MGKLYILAGLLVVALVGCPAATPKASADPVGPRPQTYSVFFTTNLYDRGCTDVREYLTGSPPTVPVCEYTDSKGQHNKIVGPYLLTTEAE